MVALTHRFKLLSFFHLYNLTAIVFIVKLNNAFDDNNMVTIAHTFIQLLASGGSRERRSLVVYAIAIHSGFKALKRQKQEGWLPPTKRASAAKIN